MNLTNVNILNQVLYQLLLQQIIIDNDPTNHRMRT